MDHIDKQKLIRANTRLSLLGNSLVLVAPKDWEGANITINEKLDLAKLLGDGRLAVAGTESVPAGAHGRFRPFTAARRRVGKSPLISGRCATSLVSS